MNKPDFFIVGAPKCGTTAMDEYLSRHPEIFIPSRKEFYFFGSDLNYQRPNRMNLEFYLSYFQDSGEAKRIGESSVMYLYSSNAAEEIKQFNPDARIIMMLRNPVDMMWAFHTQLLFTSDETLENFEDALAAEGERRAGQNIPRTTTLIDYLYYREVASYAKQVKRYLEVFSKDQVHIIIFDDFRADSAAEFRKTLEFLGVDPSFETDLTPVNTSKQQRSPLLAKLLTIPRLLSRFSIKSIWIKSLGVKVLKKLSNLNTKPLGRNPIAPELRKRLQADFLEDVKELSELLGRDLTFWCEDEN